VVLLPAKTAETATQAFSATTTDDWTLAQEASRKDWTRKAEGSIVVVIMGNVVEVAVVVVGAVALELLLVVTKVVVVVVAVVVVVVVVPPPPAPQDPPVKPLRSKVHPPTGALTGGKLAPEHMVLAVKDRVITVPVAQLT